MGNFKPIRLVGKHTFKDWTRKPRFTKVKSYKVFKIKQVHVALKRKKDNKPIVFTSWKDAKGFLDKIKKGNPKLKVYATYKY